MHGEQGPAPHFQVMAFPFAHQQRMESANQVPARVRVALEFLHELNDKTAAYPCATEHAVEVVDGQVLTPTEEITQTAALQMLASYFRGSLEPSTWEQAAMFQQQGPMILLPCPGCNGDPEHLANCKQCGGRGKVALYRI